MKRANNEQLHPEPSPTLIVPKKKAPWHEVYELSIYQCSTLPSFILPHTISCAFVLAFDNNHNILLGKHAKRGYDLLGGHCEQGETPEQAACREVMEEAGLHVEQDQLKLLGYEVIHDPSPTHPIDARFPYPDSYFILYVVGNVDSSLKYTPRASTEKEHEDMKETKWFSLEEMRAHKWCIERPGVLELALKLL